MKKIILTIFGLLAFPSVSNASIIDLTTDGSSGSSNGASFYEAGIAPTGTGNLNPFYRLNGGGPSVYGGYNTSDRPFNTSDNTYMNGAWTYDLLLSTVPIVTIGTVAYREFILDINQTGGAGSFLSLDTLEIFQTNTGGASSYSALGPSIWELAADDWIKLDSSLNAGSGKGDMYAYIPDDSFSGLDYVYLNSSFGTRFSNNDGFEEWAVADGASAVPVPTTLLLLGTGLAGLVGSRIRRKK